jgi:hypothetical protein
MAAMLGDPDPREFRWRATLGGRVGVGYLDQASTAVAVLIVAICV